jgi:predicted transcriptional regulator
MALKEVLEAWKEKPLSDLLRELYVDKDMSIHTIARELHISSGMVHKYLAEYGITKNNNLFKL